MLNGKVSRKSFLKKVGVGVAAASVAPQLVSAKVLFSEDPNLSEKQKQFLSKYEEWLKEFHGYIKIRSENPSNNENNKFLMELTSQADSWRNDLVEHMKNSLFSDYYNKITKDVTLDIRERLNC